MTIPSEATGEATRVSCEVCLKEVPLSEATVAEAADYFTYFCGLECYEEWKRRSDREPPPQAASPAA